MKKLLSVFVIIFALCWLTGWSSSGALLPNGLVDVNDIQKLIDTLPIKHPSMWRGSLWVDRYYRATTVEEMERYTKKASRETNSLPWNGEAGDCDDAAVVFKASLIRQAVQRGGENPIPAGIISLMDASRSDVHAMVWFVDDTMGLWLIEPRGGLMRHWTDFPGLKIFWMMG